MHAARAVVATRAETREEDRIDESTFPGARRQVLLRLQAHWRLGQKQRGLKHALLHTNRGGERCPRIRAFLASGTSRSALERASSHFIEQHDQCRRGRLFESKHDLVIARPIHVGFQGSAGADVREVGGAVVPWCSGAVVQWWS